MNCFAEMSRRIQTSPQYDSFRRFSSPLKTHFGINHFWYYRITDAGHYSFLGTHTAWNEHCFNELPLHLFPCLRHPSLLNTGITLMKASRDPEL